MTKTIKSITYSVPQINCFLESIGYPYAASCFRAEWGGKERITNMEIEKFLRYYFADTNKAQFIYRKMETVVTGHMTFNESK